MIECIFFTRPKTKEELFNHRHAILRNVIERIFGVLKRRFRILLLAPEYNVDIQSRLPTALCALHNFIRTHDPDDDNETQENGVPVDNGDEDVQVPGLFLPEVEPEAGGPGGTSQNRAISMRNRIASELWAQYQQVLRDREGDMNESEEDDEDGELEGDMEM